MPAISVSRAAEENARFASSSSSSIFKMDGADVTTYLFGKRFPNRLFVGGLPVNTTASELADFFKQITKNVTEAKVIMDEDGISKGYGFVTFHTKKDIQIVMNMGTIFFRNKKLNLGPAVKKEGPTVQPEVVIVPNAPSHGQYYYPEPVPMQMPACNMGYQPQPRPLYYQQTPQGVFYTGYPAQPPTYLDPCTGQVYQVMGDSVQWLGAEVPYTPAASPLERRGSSSSTELEPVVPGNRSRNGNKTKSSKRRGLPPRLRAIPRAEVRISAERLF